MDYLVGCIVIAGLFQVLVAATVEDKYEPMVAFICERPAMHRGVSGWLPDKSTDCLDRMEDILAYCKTVYPDHNITNVVEASYLVTISDWPMGTAERLHQHRVRPFRCLVGGFQSDALLVPQHCEFDHRHDQSLCEGFTHWNVVADEACRKKGHHLESFGMLLNCRLGKFSGVEYVCCPNETKPNYHPPQEDDKPDSWHVGSDEDLDDEFEDSSDEDSAGSFTSSSDSSDSSYSSSYSSSESSSSEDDSQSMGSSSSHSSSSSSSEEDLDENQIDLYEAYLRGQIFPAQYNNEHKKFLAAKSKMKKNQQHKVTKLLQEWEAARDHVNVVRKTDSAAADAMNSQIASRFQKLYVSFENEDLAEKQQLLALHQQHVQAALNERKRDAMDKYMKVLENGDVEKIIKYLHSYIKAEEKDRMHTVNHFEHVKYASPKEALRIHPFIINHLRLSEQRIDQALKMLTRYPDIEVKVRPEIEEFMKRFDAIANSISTVVLPVPDVSMEDSDSNSMDVSEYKDESSNTTPDDSDSRDFDLDSEESFDSDSDEIRENEHDYERRNEFMAHHLQDKLHVKQGFAESAVSSSQVGSTIGIALGSVSVFVIILVAIIMVKRNQNQRSYSRVEPPVNPDDPHLANMQMNGYENPTYKYFEVQTNPKA